MSSIRQFPTLLTRCPPWIQRMFQVIGLPTTEGNNYGHKFILRALLVLLVFPIFEIFVVLTSSSSSSSSSSSLGRSNLFNNYYLLRLSFSYPPPPPSLSLSLSGKLSRITFQSLIHAYMYINNACNLISVHQYLSKDQLLDRFLNCLLYTSPSPRDQLSSRMPSSA